MATAMTFPKLAEADLTRKINLVSDTIKVLLFTAAAPTVSMVTLADFLAAATEVTTQTGYTATVTTPTFTAGGVALSGQTIATTSNGNVTTVNASNPVYSTTNPPTARYALFVDTAPAGVLATSAAGCLLIQVQDFGSAIAVPSLTLGTTGFYQVTSN